MCIRCWRESYMYIPFRIFRLRHGVFCRLLLFFCFVYFHFVWFRSWFIQGAVTVFGAIGEQTKHKIDCWSVFVGWKVEAFTKKREPHRLLTRLLMAASAVLTLVIVVVIVGKANQLNSVFFFSSSIHRVVCMRENSIGWCLYLCHLCSEWKSSVWKSVGNVILDFVECFFFSTHSYDEYAYIGPTYMAKYWHNE